MTPFNDFTYLVNHVLLGEEPTIEDFILLVGTVVAFVAFILWCCFPIQPKDSINHRQFSCKSIHSLDATTQVYNSYTKSSSPFTIHNDYILKNGSVNNCSNSYSSSNGYKAGHGVAEAAAGDDSCVARSHHFY